MSLQLPVLDDTDFERLVDGALARLETRLDVEWRAASEGDPGRMLIEAMAYLADQTVYRLNRLPKKVYIAFLRLLGHTLQPPTAAEALIEFIPRPPQPGRRRASRPQRSRSRAGHASPRARRARRRPGKARRSLSRWSPCALP